MVNDCWFVAYRNGRTVDVNQKQNAHEVLFSANAKFNPTPGAAGAMAKIISMFRNEYPGNRHRSRKLALDAPLP